MGNFEFVEGQVAPGFEPDFEAALFNQEKHRLLQADKWLGFHLVRPDKMKVVASVFFSPHQGVALSPASAPFGGIECADHIPAETLYQFIGHYETALRQKNIHCIHIKLCPSLYCPSLYDMVAVLLLNHGYQVVNAEVGACVQVEPEALLMRFDPWEKRKLKQAIKAKLNFRVLPPTHLDEVYHFIHRCRSERGHSLSMDYTSLENTVLPCKDNFFLFGLYSDQELVAASIGIAVNSRVFYNFYSAHDSQYDAVSPVVFLIHEMHHWCYRQGFVLLDLGTSAHEGKPNFPLIDFKLRLGAKPAMKLTLEKRL